MFAIFDLVRTWVSGSKTERSASAAAGMPGSSAFDDELVRLRRDWVESHRAFSAAQSSERERAIRAVHASASAYFDYVDRIRVEDHIPTQLRHGYAGAGTANARTSLHLAAAS
jgi:hypothetical protein